MKEEFSSSNQNFLSVKRKSISSEEGIRRDGHGRMKLSRTCSSSLLRTPTIKSGIHSLSAPSEAQEDVSNSKTRPRKSKSFARPRNSIASLWKGSFSSKVCSMISATKPLFKFPHMRVQLLFPPLVIILVPWLWYYYRPPFLHLLVLGLFFDCIFVVVYVMGIIMSLKAAFPAIIIKALGFLSQYDGRKTPVTWTIGSSPPRTLSKAVKEGVLVFSNGDVYEGEFYQGKCSGSGVYYFRANGRYEGDWVDGKYDGYGVETWAKGSRYRGQYRQGLRHGYGVYRFYSGDMYAGEWANGQSHGCGVQSCDDGSQYVGEFKHGVKHGVGYYQFRNGDMYAGEYFADKMHGFGVYSFANGHCYEGAWHEGKKQGLGIYTFKNGESHSGYWHLGILQTPSSLDSKLRMTNGASHTNILHAVQEARHAASKAFEAPPVDERVKKVVAAANKAATSARVAAVKAVQRRMHEVAHADV